MKIYKVVTRESRGAGRAFKIKSHKVKAESKVAARRAVRWNHAGRQIVSVEEIS